MPLSSSWFDSSLSGRGWIGEAAPEDDRDDDHDHDDDHDDGGNLDDDGDHHHTLLGCSPTPLRARVH